MNIEQEINITKAGNNKEKVMVNLIFTANRINDKITELLNVEKLLPQHYNVLRILKGKHPNPANMAEIKSVMLDKNPDLTRLCVKLINEGYITKESNNLNKRQKSVTISQKGLDKLNAMNSKIEDFYNQIININDQEIEQLSGLLDAIRCNWNVNLPTK
jgi:DNA-binding MarR family transcriptional regulator